MRIYGQTYLLKDKVIYRGAPLLKRPDERFVTMKAYDNPVFVEDMVRNVAVALKADSRVSWFKVHAVNFESIHNHNAFAETSWSRPGGGEG